MVQEVDGWKGRYFEDFEIGDHYKHPFGRTITEADNTWFTLLTMNTNQNHFANLGWDKITMPNPVFVGDTIYAESVVLEKRESKSRPYGGIVTAKTRGINQDGKTVIKWKRTFFVYKKDAPQDKDWFPKAEINIEDFEL